ncbi:MAG: hypothetical protein RLZZ99_766 [Actinomycetota bacterium]
MRTILISNLAGGTGKTTTAQSIAVAAAEYGKSVLAIDADPSAALTFLNGVENPRLTAAEYLQGECELNLALIKTVDRFSLVPSASRLALAEVKDSNRLKSSWSDFDIVLIDSPTGPHPITLSLIELADLVIAPVTRSMLSLRGVLNLRDLVQQSSNRPEIRVLDIELNEWDPELKELLSSDFKFIEPAIRNDVAMVTAQSGGRSTLSLSPQSNAAADYRELTYSLLEEIGLF